MRDVRLSKNPAADSAVHTDGPAHSRGRTQNIGPPSRPAHRSHVGLSQGKGRAVALDDEAHRICRRTVPLFTLEGGGFDAGS